MNKNVNNVLDKNIHSMLVGCLLGDAHINRSGNKTFITFEQSIKHESYINHIYDLLNRNGILLNDIKLYSRKDIRYKNINQSLYFKTKNTSLFNDLADMFLCKANKKIVPHNIDLYLNPISLAYWICDDGQKVKNGGITLCTDSYNKDEINLLIKGLETRLDAVCSIHNKKGKKNIVYSRIYIKKSSFDNIKLSIQDIIHKSFLYKINN